MDAVQPVLDAVQQTCPITIVVTLCASYVVVKIMKLLMAPNIPRVWVPMEPGEPLT